MPTRTFWNQRTAFAEFGNGKVHHTLSLSGASCDDAVPTIVIESILSRKDFHGPIQTSFLFAMGRSITRTEVVLEWIAPLC